MARNFATWVSGKKCTGSVTPGAKALMAGVLEFESRATNLGIYNCRTVRGGSDTSVHAEGRAIDIGMPMRSGRPTSHGHALCKLLIDNADKLGLQAVIYDRKIYSKKSPNGRAYTGVHPHYDHLHVELSWNAANKLTLATVRAVLKGEAPKPAPKPTPKPEPKPTLKKLPVLSKGDRDDVLVPFLKRFFWAKPPNQDEVFGTGLQAKVRAYQLSKGLVGDGVVGPLTYRKIASGGTKLPAGYEAP
jgi:hypothetical protein